MTSRATLLLLATLALAGCASAHRSSEPTHTLAIGHFLHVESLGYPADDDEVHVGTIFKATVTVDLVLAGRMDKRRIEASFGDASVERKFYGPYYFVLTHYRNGEIGITAFGPVRDGFCLRDDSYYSAAFPGVFARLRREDPCKVV